MIIKHSLRAISYHAGIGLLRGPLTLRRIFTHAWQLQTPDGWIVTVAALPYNGPLSIRVAQLDGRNLRPNMGATLEQASLTVGPIRIHLPGATPWQPHPPEHAAPILPAALSTDIQYLRGWAGGIGAFAPSLPTRACGPGKGDAVGEGSSPLPGYQGGTVGPRARATVPTGAERPAASRRGATAFAPDVDADAWTGAGRYRHEAYLLAEALATGDVAGMREAAPSLLGLGPGLTPSGDDLLCGVLAGLYVMGNRLPRHRAWAARVRVELGAIVEDMAPSRTAALSCTLLHWAAQGVAAEPLLDVLCTLGSGTAVCGLPELLGIGHHSGADMLAGALLAAGAMLEQEEADGEGLVRAAERLL